MSDTQKSSRTYSRGGGQRKMHENGPTCRNRSGQDFEKNVLKRMGENSIRYWNRQRVQERLPN